MPRDVRFEQYRGGEVFKDIKTQRCMVLNLKYCRKEGLIFKNEEEHMEGIVFKVFEALFKSIGFLIIAGIFLSVLSGLQKKAFDSKRAGLTSMLGVNQQLVGRTR